MSLGVNSSVPAVVLGLHHGTVGIARSLGRLGVRVHAVGNPRSPAAASRYLRSVLPWNFDDSDDQVSVARLVDLGAQLGSRAVLIPTTDDLAHLVAGHAQALHAGFR